MKYVHSFKTGVGVIVLRAAEEGLHSLQITKAQKALKIGVRESSFKEAPVPIQRLLKKAERRLRRYFCGRKVSFRSLTVDGSKQTPFSKRVLSRLRDVSWGKTLSYQSLAEESGSPRSCRAVGRVLNHNRLPILIPCHRIIRKSGELGGYSRGRTLKKQLLKLEGVNVDDIPSTRQAQRRSFDR